MLGFRLSLAAWHANPRSSFDLGFINLIVLLDDVGFRSSCLLNRLWLLDDFMNIDGMMVDNDGKPLKAVRCVLWGGPVVTHANTDGGQVYIGVGLLKARMEIRLMVVVIVVATIIHVLAAHVGLGLALSYI
ncbi:hypothetical protein Tco_1059740 [Tanacetum coccineum]